VVTAEFFDTLVVATGARTAQIHAQAVARGMNFRRIDDAALGLSLDETTTEADLEAIWQVFGDEQHLPSSPNLSAVAADALPQGLKRTSTFLTHPTFNRHHSETEMLRYLRRLADRDIALDRAMIPLGSCTMKLNATSEMIPVTWPKSAGSIRSRRRTRRKGTPRSSPISSACCARPPATPPCRCNPMRGPRANTRGCS
jgi:glycine dehydrogenase